MPERSSGRQRRLYGLAFVSHLTASSKARQTVSGQGLAKDAVLDCRSWCRAVGRAVVLRSPAFDWLATNYKRMLIDWEAVQSVHDACCCRSAGVGGGGRNEEQLGTRTKLWEERSEIKEDQYIWGWTRKNRGGWLCRWVTRIRRRRKTKKHDRRRRCAAKDNVLNY